MTIFPTNNYEFELTKESTDALSELEKNTLISDSLFVSERTKKAFIGQINDNGFEIISSKPGRGPFCIYTGKLKSKKGTLEIKIHKAYKIMLSFIYLFPITLFIIALFTMEKEIITSLIFTTILILIALRFVFTELAFRFISRNVLKELTEIIGINNLKKTKNNII